MVKPVSLIVIVSLIGLIFITKLRAMESLPVAMEASKPDARSTISPEESEQRLREGMLLFERGKTEAAIYTLQQLEKADPTNYQVLLKLGEIAIEAKNWAYSIQVLRKASFLRPKDIQVRLVLMDIYKAYQMPIQEIMLAREILALDPQHIIATQRLAELYREQSMQGDETKIRQHLKKLLPDDYKNLKRLAVIFDLSGQPWEAAKNYEKIRKYYPGKLKDIQRLAALYDKLGEAFREAEVLDHIAEHGGGRSWMQSRAETVLRKQNNIYDPVLGSINFKTESEPTMKVDSAVQNIAYTRIFVRSSLDMGISAKYVHLHHRGIGLLDGTMDIDNATVLINGAYHWPDLYLDLNASVGVLHDQVSGRLFGSDSSVTVDDFPFLTDPSFNSYGGTIPIGQVQFTARPWLNSIFNVTYEHNLVEDLDARLSLFTYDRITAVTSYVANEKTELQARMDNFFISDGNHRLHGLVSGYYTLWGSTPKYDYRGRRMEFFRFLPGFFVRLGYEFEYFKDNRLARDGKYETFLNPEYRHKGILQGQAELYSFASSERIFAAVRLVYGGGTTQVFKRGLSARLFYYDSFFDNEVGLSYTYDDERSNNTTTANRRIAGLSKSHQISLDFKWHF